MTNRFTLPPSIFALALCASLGGCLGSGERHGSTPGRRPAMPTMVLPAPDSMRSGPESEVVAHGVRAALGNDIDGVVRILKLVEDPSRRAQLADEIMTQLSEHDPNVAARLALAVGGEFQRLAVVEKAGRKLTQHDPEFALRWALELPPGAAGRQMSRAIVDERVSANPREAMDRISALPASAVRDDLLVLGAGAWSRRDAEAAISWLRDQPENELKQRLTSSVGFEVAQARPDRAISVAEMLPAGRNRWLLLSAIAQTWVAVDSKAALSWAGQLPAGEPRDAALAGIDTGFGMPASRRIAGAPGTRGGSSRTRGGAAAAAAWPELNSPSFAAWLAAQPRG
ncbi:MAG: hypothetical protein ACREH8_09670, partial [Opitutaceae bacterium]